MKRPLSARQADIFAAILEAIAELGRAPTMRELGARVGIGSTNAVQQHLKALERKGWIARGERGMWRGIRIIGDACGHCGGIGVVP